MEEKCSTFSLRKLSSRLMQMVIVTAFLLVNCLPAMAQSNTKVKGVITSGADGLPLIGVNVVEKGTTNGTVTDFDGNFELTVSSNAVLDISYIGFLSQEVKIVAGKTTYNVVLKEDSQALEEVVVVGYGVQKKKLVTGATVQVSGDNLQKLSTTNALGALQSQSPGVNITQSSGQPGEGFKVVIRGLGTVGSSGPLYVIDGVAGGDGVIGELNEPIAADDLIIMLKRNFDVECVMANELLRRPISKIAVCGGAGSFLLDDAIAAGADAFITGEMHYHEFFGHEQEIQICVIGHYQSEQFTSEIFRSIITEKCPGVKCEISEINTNPIIYL